MGAALSNHLKSRNTPSAKSPRRFGISASCLDLRYLPPWPMAAVCPSQPRRFGRCFGPPCFGWRSPLAHGTRDSSSECAVLKRVPS
jgi:hypothetical protein